MCPLEPYRPPEGAWTYREKDDISVSITLRTRVAELRYGLGAVSLDDVDDSVGN